MAKDVTKPEVIILLNEAYEREKWLRARWLNTHQDELKLAVTLDREPTNYYEEDVTRHKMMGGLTALAQGHVIAGYNRKKTPIRDARTIAAGGSIRHENSIINFGLGTAAEDPRLARPDTDLTLDPIMRPVEDKLKKMLSKPGSVLGRKNYLKERAKKFPVNKYYFPECTSWDHGWFLGDSSLLERATYGRIWQLNRTLRSRVGPQPDPDHYYPPIVPGYAKCKTTN
uniref:Sperm microtubule inner protein 1 C-terminal domain-containing protein n=1 Tax=Heliothis virescens TaxID=7102 RepID=A0A2A4JRZ1_HELVI